MGILAEYRNRLLKTGRPEVVEKGILKVIKANSDLLIDTNTNQLLQGIDSLGIPLDPPYRSAQYAEFKLTLNPLGVVDLKLTGEFHGKWRMKVNDFPVSFYSADKKAKALEGKYGKDIYGITSNNLDAIIQSDIKPETQQYFRREVFMLR